MEFHFRGGKVFAGHVDISRLARNLKRQLRPDADLGECLNIVSRLFGVESYYHLRRRAADPDIRGWDWGRALDRLQAEAVSCGESFPRRLPQRFDRVWQQRASQLLDKALAAKTHGRLDAVAIVGPSGCGKSLLVADAVARKSGAIVDVGQADDMTVQRHTLHPKEGLLVFDQCAAPAPDRDDKAAAWRRLSGQHTATTLNGLREERRLRMTRVPLDSMMHLTFSRPKMTTDLRARLTDNPGTSLVTVFAHENEAIEAFKSSPRFGGNSRALSAELDWQRLHVISLADMSSKIVELG